MAAKETAVIEERTALRTYRGRRGEKIMRTTVRYPARYGEVLQRHADEAMHELAVEIRIAVVQYAQRLEEVYSKTK